MKTFIHIFIFTGICLTTMITVAMTDEFDFTGNVTEERYRNLSAQIRCLVCQNESLASSHADLAKDLKREVFNLMDEGKSDEEVKAYLVQRYGKFVLYMPPVSGSTLILWFTPFLLLLVGAFVLFRVIKAKGQQNDTPLTQKELDRVKAILGETNTAAKPENGESS